MAFVHAVRAGGFPQHSDTRFDPVPSVAVAGLSRRERDQLADHQGREGNGALDFLARQRARYRRCAAAEKTPISGPNDTLGSVYFDRLFPMGAEAMLEAVDLVKAGKAPRIKQDKSRGDSRRTLRVRTNARIDWGKPWQQIDRLIRGCNPAPGAWTKSGRENVEDIRSDALAGEGTPKASAARWARSLTSK